MTITYDIYFFESLGAWAVILLLSVAVIYCGTRFKRFGKWSFSLLMIFLYSYNLAMCSEITARVYRPAIAESKVHTTRLGGQS